jgi:4-hydroxy-tetrahydrodipicolinate reductase
MRIAVLGAGGRMGRQLLSLIEAGAATGLDWSLAGAWDRQMPAGRTDATTDLQAALQGADVAIEFTHPAALGEIARALSGTTIALVSGTTGLGDEGRASLRRLAEVRPVLHERNMSIGVHLATRLVREAAAALGDAYDVEISESHHRHKVDAPSGTALNLGEAVADARGGQLDALAEYARHGSDVPRRPGAIGFAVRRGGDIVGEHEVAFIGDFDVLEIRHRASSRALFAQGALRAASWLVGQPPGLYGLDDMLGAG